MVDVWGIRLGQILNKVAKLPARPTQEQFDEALKRARDETTLEIECRRQEIPTQIAIVTRDKDG